MKQYTRIQLIRILLLTLRKMWIESDKVNIDQLKETLRESEYKDLPIEQIDKLINRLSAFDKTILGVHVSHSEEENVTPKYEEDIYNPRLLNKILDNNSILSRKEMDIFKMFYGFKGSGPKDLSEIALEKNLTPLRVRQILTKAYHRIKHKFRSEDLKRYLQGSPPKNRSLVFYRPTAEELAKVCVSKMKEKDYVKINKISNNWTDEVSCDIIDPSSKVCIDVKTTPTPSEIFSSSEERKKLTDQARKVKKYNKEGWTLLEFDGFWNIYIADEIATEDNYNTYIISLFDFPSIPELLNSDIDIFDYVINNLAKIDRIGKPTSESYVTTYWEDNISFDLLLKSVEASLYNFFKTTISGVRNGYDKSKYNPMLSTVYYKPEINGINEDDRTNILRTQSYRISHGIKNTIGLIITDFGNDIEDLRSIARTKTLNKDKTTEPNIDDIVKRLEGYHVELSDLEARFDALNKAHSRRKEDLNIKEVDLRDEVEEVYEKKVKPYAKNKGIKTKLIYKDISSTKGPIKVNISVDEIKEEVLLNLMKNSIDHGYPKKKSAILTFEVSKVDENYVNISYRDNGIGIKPSNWKDNYFYAFSDTTKTPLNTGLQIIAATVELHGCKIDTYEKNEVIIGFNFTLPKN